MIDSTIVRAHQHASCAQNSANEGFGRSRGGLTTKIHAVVDQNGLPPASPDSPVTGEVPGNASVTLKVWFQPLEEGPAMNTLDGVVADGHFQAGTLSIPVAAPPGPLILGIRPEHMIIRDAPTDDSVALTLDVAELVEPDTLLFLRSGPLGLVARAMRDLADLRPGQPVHVEMPASSLHFFDARTGGRLP